MITYRLSIDRKCFLALSSVEVHLVFMLTAGSKYQEDFEDNSAVWLGWTNGHRIERCRETHQEGSQGKGVRISLSIACSLSSINVHVMHGFICVCGIFTKLARYKSVNFTYCIWCIMMHIKKIIEILHWFSKFLKDHLRLIFTTAL